MFSCRHCTYLSIRGRVFHNLVQWLCVVMLALQPLETLAAVQQRTNSQLTIDHSDFAPRNSQLLLSADSADFTDFGEKGGMLAAAESAPLVPRNSPLASAELLAPRNAPLATPSLSGAQPPYPLNHVLDGSVAVVGTPPANHNFETPASMVGTPPTNHDMAAASYASGAPTNHDFETGTLSGWTTSGTVSVQSNATQGDYASLGASGVLTSSAFTVAGETQQLVVAIGYLHATLTSYVEVYVHSGANYATQTKIGALFCLNCGWRQEAIDLSAYAGQSIQLRFKRIGGTIGVEAPQAMVVLPAYTTTGVTERVSEGDGNVYALLRSGAAMVSTPFTVANDAQQLTLRLSGRSTSSDYYAVRILSGAAYTVSTQVAYDTVEDSWRTVEFDLTAWRGQSIRLRVERSGGVIGVDDAGVQRIAAPGWVIGAAVVRSDPDSNHYVSANAPVVSDAFVVDSAAQQLTLRYRHGGSAGATFIVSVLRGATFGEEVTAGSRFSTATSWQTLRVAMGAYLGETIKLKLSFAPLTRMHFDDVGVGERALPGWSAADPQQGIGVGEDANGSYATPAGIANALSLTSQEVDTGLVDGAGVHARHYAVAYDIGYSTGNGLYVYWRNSDGVTYKVFQDAANSPTGYRVRYFPVYDVLGLRGRFILALAGGGKLYSLGDNVARQQLSEPFTYKVGLQIDTASGSFGYQALDIQTGGARPLLFARYYNGHADRLGPLGYGWSHSYETRLVLTEEGNTGVLFGAGKELFFTWSSIGQTFTPADARIHDTLVRNTDGSYLFTTKTNQRYTFDAAGVLTTITDANDNATRFGYSAGRLTGVLAPDGVTLTLSYDGAGRLMSVGDPLGASILYTYDAAGDLTSVQRPDAGAEQYSYDRHRLRQVTDATGQTLFQNSFDAWQRVVQQSDALSKTLTIQYSTPGAGATTVTDSEGGVTVYYFDRQQRTTDWVAPGGQTTRYLYDATGNLQKVIDGGAGEWNYAYDGAGNLLSSLDPLGAPTQISYTPTHLPTTLTDARGAVTQLGYDTRGNLTQVIDASNKQWSYVYDAAGRLTSIVDPLGQVEQYSYDAAGNRLTRTDALGAVWRWRYDAAGRLAAETDPNGYTTTYVYDGAGRISMIRDALGGEQFFIYDLAGHLVRAQDALSGQTVWDYDERGLVEAKIDAAGKRTTYAYDDNRNMVALTDPLSHTTHYAYDGDNRLTEIVRPDGGATHYAYDAVGRMSAETNPLGQTTSYAYDAAGRLITLTLPNGGIYAFAYDAAGNRTQTTDPLGRVTQVGYDALNRIITVTDPAGMTTQTVYDAAGRKTQRIDAAGQVVSYSYDAAGRLTSIVDPLGRVSAFAYDAAGAQLATADALGRTSAIGYDALYRPVTLTNAAGHVSVLRYDAGGRLREMQAPSGGVTHFAYDSRGLQTGVMNALGQSTLYAYDDAGRLVQMTDPAGQVTTYGYDVADRLTSVTDPLGKTTSFGYDALNRLTDVGYANGDVVSYGYDTAGKRLTETVNGLVTSYLYDAAGQVVSNGVLSYTYDANGNLTGAGSDAYAWDWANRLVGASVGNSSIAYSYDALGVRTGAVVDGVASSLLWDRVTGQLVDDGDQGYVHAPGVLAQLGVGGRGDLLADGLNSVRGVTDASGALVGTADFGVFGQNRGQAGAASSVGFGGAFWIAALRDQSQAPAGLVSAALFGALPTSSGGNNSDSVSTALAHLEQLQQVNPTPNRFVGSAEDTDESSGSWGGFGGGGAPAGSPALALLLPQTSDPEPANQLPGPYTYASHRPTQGSGGASALPGANPSLFAAWLLGLEATQDLDGLAGLGQAIARVLLYVACVLDGECLASLTELQALGEEFGSNALENLRWTAGLLGRAADMWPLLPNIPRPLAELMSLGLGFVPVVGDLLDLYAGLTGYDPITGERLPEWAQALALAAVFMPFVSGNDLRIADEALEWSDEAVAGYRSFTRDNFRENLSRFTDFRPDRSVEAHHVLPQAFAREFDELVGVNVHWPKYGAWVNKKAHQGWSYQYNQKWKIFFERTKEPSLQQVEDFAAQLAEEYDFDVYLSR